MDDKPTNVPKGHSDSPNIQGKIIEKSQRLTEDWLERGFNKDIQRPQSTDNTPHNPSGSSEDSNHA